MTKDTNFLDFNELVNGSNAINLDYLLDIANRKKGENLTKKDNIFDLYESIDQSTLTSIEKEKVLDAYYNFSTYAITVDNYCQKIESIKEKFVNLLKNYQNKGVFDYLMNRKKIAGVFYNFSIMFAYELDKLKQDDVATIISDFYLNNMYFLEVSNLYEKYFEYFRIELLISHVLTEEFQEFQFKNLTFDKFKFIISTLIFLIENNVVEYFIKRSKFFLTNPISYKGVNGSFTNINYYTLMKGEFEEQERFYYRAIKKFNEESKDLRLNYAKNLYLKVLSQTESNLIDEIIEKTLLNNFGTNFEFLIPIFQEDYKVVVVIDKENKCYEEMSIHQYKKLIASKHVSLEKFINSSDEKSVLYDFEMNAYTGFNIQESFDFDEILTDIYTSLTLFSNEQKNLEYTDVFSNSKFSSILGTVISSNYESLKAVFNKGKTNSFEAVFNILFEVHQKVDNEITEVILKNNKNTFINSSFVSLFKHFISVRLLYSHLLQKYSNQNDYIKFVALLEFNLRNYFEKITLNSILTVFEVAASEEVINFNKALEEGSFSNEKEYNKFKEEEFLKLSNNLNTLYTNSYNSLLSDVKTEGVNNCTWLLNPILDEYLNSFKTYVAYILANGFLDVLTFKPVNSNDNSKVLNEDAIDFNYFLNLLYNDSFNVNSLYEFFNLLKDTVNEDTIDNFNKEIHLDIRVITKEVLDSYLLRINRLYEYYSNAIDE